MNLKKHLLYFLTVILYLFHTLPQAENLFHFFYDFCSVNKVGSQTRLSINVGVKQKREARLHKIMRHLRM